MYFVALVLSLFLDFIVSNLSFTSPLVVVCILRLDRRERSCDYIFLIFKLGTNRFVLLRAFHRLFYCIFVKI